MPEQICTQCAEKAVELYLFKQNCERTDAALRQQLGKSPFVDYFKSDDEQMRPYCFENDHQFGINQDDDDDDDGSGSENIIIKPEIHLENEDGSSLESTHVGGGGGGGGGINNSTSIEMSCNNYNRRNDDVIYENRSVCNKKRDCNSQEEMNEMNKKHHLTKPFVCETCGKCFSRDDLLLRHKIIHAIKFQEKYTNDKSSSSIEHDQNLKMTTEQQNETSKKQNIDDVDDDNNIQCTICKKQFSKVSHLTRHTKIHAAIKPYSCQLCSKGFARAEQLMNHMNAHSGIKPHVCKICSKGINNIL